MELVGALLGMRSTGLEGLFYNIIYFRISKDAAIHLVLIQRNFEIP